MTERKEMVATRYVVSWVVGLMLVGSSGMGFGQTPDAKPQTTDRVLTLDAKPDPIAFNLASTAVIVVDMQNDFGAKGGMFDRAGIDISGIQKAIGPTAKVVAAARRAGVKVIYLKMGYRPDLSDLGSDDSVNRTRHLRLRVGDKVTAPDGSESRILVRDTWNTRRFGTRCSAITCVSCWPTV